MPHGEMGLNLLQGLEMIAHVSQGVLDQRCRKFYKLPGVWSDWSRRTMVVLMLRDSDCCAAAGQDSSDYGHQNTHRSSWTSGNERQPCFGQPSTRQGGRELDWAKADK